MAEGFEPYHVPQQSRRDKLREVVQNNHPACVESPTGPAQHHLHSCAAAGLLPLYDQSLLPSDFLTCATTATAATQNSSSVAREDGANLMSYLGGGNMNMNNVAHSCSSSSANLHHHYLDPHSSLHINPSSIHGIANNNPFLYEPQSIRDFEQSFHHSEAMIYKPEPLSLSLSSHQQNNNNLPLELNLPRFEHSAIFDDDKIGYAIPIGGSGSTSNDLSRSPVPLGPFTGYSSVLKGSKFLRPAQQLLDELCEVERGVHVQKVVVDPGFLDASPVGSGIVDDSGNGGDGGEQRRKRSKLISMLDEVYRRYKQYCQQMQMVIASFESVAGLGNAAPYAYLAIKAMSKHFKSLKYAIADQLQFANKAHGKDEVSRYGNIDKSFYGQRPLQNSSFVEHQPVWRPQRGLPERAVTVLRAWLFEHFLHPYPTDTDKLMLAKQTGLSRNQVSNWFINARVRLWKPMVEEIHMLETRQAQKSLQRPEDRNNPNHKLPSDHRQIPPPAASSSQALISENASTSAPNVHRVHDAPSKRTRSEFPEMPPGGGADQNHHHPVNLSSYGNFPGHEQMGVTMGGGNGNGGVSLTLGLHQNNGIGLPEPYSVSAAAAHRFGHHLGMDASSSEGYVIAGYEGQNRHFGRDLMGSQLLHDFVG